MSGLLCFVYSFASPAVLPIIQLESQRLRKEGDGVLLAQTDQKGGREEAKAESRSSLGGVSVEGTQSREKAMQEKGEGGHEEEGEEEEEDGERET